MYMNTTVIGIKDFRQNIAQLTKEGRAKNISYIVTVRNEPIFEVKPCLNHSIEMDDTQITYYKMLEKTLDFWNDEADDHIFAQTE